MNGTRRFSAGFPVASMGSVLSSPCPLPFSTDQVMHFRKQGFLVVPNFFSQETLRLYNEDLRRATKARGDSLLPNPEECRSGVEINIRSKEQKKIDELEKAGKPVPEELRRRVPKTKFGNQRLTVRFRNRAAFLRGYKAALRKREKIAKERGYTFRSPSQVSDLDPNGGLDPRNPYGTEDEDPNRKVGYDEATGQMLTRAEMQERAKQYAHTDAFRERIDQKMHISETHRFFAQMGQAWAHLWHANDPLRKQVVGPIGGALGRAACQLGGFTGARLFTDQGTLKRSWGNAHPVHCIAPFVDFIDLRAVTATTVMPPHPLDHSRGAFVILPGSHQVLRRVTNDGRDVSLLQSMPASWDVGEWTRSIPELKAITPVEVELPPGSVLFANTHLAHAQQPNYTSSEVLTHTLFIMPDGVVYSGVRQTWMSQSKDGPLHHYRPGEPLRDELVFPLLFDTLGLD